MDFLTNLPLVQNIPFEVRLAVARVIIALAVFAILLLLRRAVTHLLLRPIRNRLQENNVGWDDRIFTAIDRFSGYLVVALAVFIDAVVLELQGGVYTFVVNLAATIAAIGFFRLIFDLGGIIISNETRLETFIRHDIPARLIPIIETIFRLIVIAIAVIAVAQVWSVNLAGIVAGLGLVGLAVSLAAKEVLDDLLGFLVIIGDDVFRQQEYIISDSGQGIVERIGLRSTRIRGLDQSLIIVPNYVLTSNAVTNWSRLEKRWFNFHIGLTYQTTIEQMDAFVSRMREMLKGREAVDPDSVLVLFTEYTASALNVLVRTYVRISDWNEAHAELHAINLEIKRICNELDVEIAYETQSLFIENIRPEWFAGSRENGGSAQPQRQRQPAQTPEHRYPGGDDDQVDGSEGGGGDDEGGARD